MTAATAAGYLGSLTLLRRLRGRSALVISAVAVAFATLASFAERKTADAGFVSAALQGAAFGLAIPLAVFALVAVALERRRLDGAVGPVAMLGGSRRMAAFGGLLSVAVVAAVLAAMVGASSAVVAHGKLDSVALVDAVRCGWIGLLTGSCYAMMFGAASTFGKRGGMRWLFLLADLLVGATTGPVALVFPRAHALNLLGADPVLELPQRASSLALVILALLYLAVACLRLKP